MFRSCGQTQASHVGVDTTTGVVFLRTGVCTVSAVLFLRVDLEPHVSGSTRRQVSHSCGQTHPGTTCWCPRDVSRLTPRTDPGGMRQRRHGDEGPSTADGSRNHAPMSARRQDGPFYGRVQELLVDVLTAADFLFLRVVVCVSVGTASGVSFLRVVQEASVGVPSQWVHRESRPKSSWSVRRPIPADGPRRCR